MLDRSHLYDSLFLAVSQNGSTPRTSTSDCNRPSNSRLQAHSTPELAPKWRGNAPVWVITAQSRGYAQSTQRFLPILKGKRHAIAVLRNGSRRSAGSRESVFGSFQAALNPGSAEIHTQKRPKRRWGLVDSSCARVSIPGNSSGRQITSSGL